jgi:ABC-type uncharacterized transport system ATPase subunit
MPDTHADVLEAREIVVRFGGLTALERVDLAVPPASIVGLVGPNGAGKSTLFGVCSGLLRASSGRVLLSGHDVTHATPQARARLRPGTVRHPLGSKIKPTILNEPWCLSSLNPTSQWPRVPRPGAGSRTPADRLEYL